MNKTKQLLLASILCGMNFAGAQTPGATPPVNAHPVMTVSPVAPGTELIKWVSMEEAVVLSAKEPRKILVDVYTDWCGWCKKMDLATFQQTDIAKYVKEKYYAVRLNAEQTEVIHINGKEYKYLPGPNGRKGYHELAAELLNGKLSYPTIVFLDENFNMIQPLPGYRGPQELDPILHYFGSDSYKSIDWDSFLKEFKSTIVN